MASGVTGDFSGLNKLVSRFGELTADKARSRLTGQLAEAARHEIQKEFDQERDPYGTPWKPLKPATLKARHGGGAGGKILQDSRRLRKSLTTPSAYAHDPAGFSVNTNVEYAAIHNYGGADAGRPDIPKRQFMPTKGNLGPIWTAALKKEAEAFVKALFGGGT